MWTERFGNLRLSRFGNSHFFHFNTWYNINLIKIKGHDISSSLRLHMIDDFIKLYM